MTDDQKLVVGGLGLLALILMRAKQTGDELSALIARGGSVDVRLTGYWPYDVGNAVERLMEGGTNDRKGRPIYTLEMYQRGQAEWVSVSGDYTIWPDGQRIVIDAWPDVVFRVVDTGSHFVGAKKVYRVAGREPLDVAVESRATHVPSLATASIVAGDNFDGGTVKTGALAGYEG